MLIKGTASRISIPGHRNRAPPPLASRARSRQAAAAAAAARSRSLARGRPGAVKRIRARIAGRLEIPRGGERRSLP